MKTSMRLFLAGSLLLAAGSIGHAAPAPAPAAPPLPTVAAGQPSLMTAADMDKRLKTMTDGVSSLVVPVSPGGPTFIVAHRDRDGEVELHDNLNDILIGRSGTSTVLVGGTVTGQRTTAPGEHRGGEITGATAYKLGPGDTLWIPAGLPHKMLIPKGKMITYFAAKSAK